MTTLEHFIRTGRATNMSATIRTELESRTSKCTGPVGERLYWLRAGLSDYPTCRFCSTKLNSSHWSGFCRHGLKSSPTAKGGPGYNLFCNAKCAGASSETKDKRKTTNLENFGVEYSFSAAEVQEKRKMTNLQKCGSSVVSPWNGESFQQKLENTYGVSKMRDIHGVHDKIAFTKAKQSLKTLYDRIPQIEENYKVQCLEKPLEILPGTRFSDYTLRWKHVCGHEYDSPINADRIAMCRPCFGGTSKAERNIADICHSFGYEVIQNTRNIIKPKEIDIWIPELNLGIEYDGTYWHSSKFCSVKESTKKLEIAKQNGIKLITIQEHLWENKPEKIISRLEHLLNKSMPKMHARKLQVKSIPLDIAHEFLVKHHLHGSAKATHAAGLYDGNAVVAVVTAAKPRWNKQFDNEIIRAASINNVRINGWMSRLFTSLRKQLDGSWITYADRCWGDGNVYEQCGFSFQTYSAPSYMWVTKNGEIFTRYQTQKSKLQVLMSKFNIPFDPFLTESENLRNCGMLQVFDKGNAVWVIK